LEEYLKSVSINSIEQANKDDIIDFIRYKYKLFSNNNHDLELDALNEINLLKNDNDLNINKEIILNKNTDINTNE
jgi:hypothetical protein